MKLIRLLNKKYKEIQLWVIKRKEYYNSKINDIFWRINNIKLIKILRVEIKEIIKIKKRKIKKKRIERN